MPKVVVQSVELPGAPADLYGMYLESATHARGAATQVDLVQVGVPDRLNETLVSGWPVRYWQPWRAYLERGR